MIISPSELTQVVTVLASIGFIRASTIVSGDYDNCQLLESTVPIIRNMTVDYHGYPLPVSCTGDVPLKKCEGTCESSVSPSVLIHPGFKNDCRCCKETSAETRQITLTTCYNNGVFLHNFAQPITVKEITGCICQSCNG